MLLTYWKIDLFSLLGKEKQELVESYRYRDTFTFRMIKEPKETPLQPSFNQKKSVVLNSTNIFTCK